MADDNSRKQDGTLIDGHGATLATPVPGSTPTTHPLSTRRATPVVEAAPEEDPFAREEPRRDLEGDYEDPRLYEPYDRDERLESFDRYGDPL